MKKSARNALLISVLIISIALHFWALHTIPLDFDEKGYLNISEDYKELIKDSQFNKIIDYKFNTEHPPLSKLVYGLSLLFFEGVEENFKIARATSSILGVLAVLAFFLIDPIASIFLAIHTTAIKYTSEVMLESLPLLASILSIFFMGKSQNSKDKFLILSSISFGIVLASKLSYSPIIIPLLYILFFDKKYPFKSYLIFIFVSLLAFLVLNPYLWNSPVEKTAEMIKFHVEYSNGEHVKQVGYSWYQPFFWLFFSPNKQTFPFDLNFVILLFALLGAKKEWKDRRYVIIWLASSFLALLIWKTKWPQYILIVIPPLCICASSGIKAFYAWVNNKVKIALIQYK